MARKKNVEVEKQLENPKCDGGQSKRDNDQSKRDNEMIDLLKQIANQNEQVIQLLTKLKERFI